jgi:hypothetical protein
MVGVGTDTAVIHLSSVARSVPASFTQASLAHESVVAELYLHMFRS